MDLTKLTVLNSVDDVFAAKNITALKTEVTSELKEVAVLFCDNTGFGQAHEPALSVKELHKKITALIAEHGEGKLIAGITGVGQFQVYLSIFINPAI